MVTPRTGKRRGRPAYDWRTDADRHMVAIGDALHAAGMTEQDATDLAVALFEGAEIKRPRAGFDTTFELRSEPGASATIKGRASTIRQKMHRAAWGERLAAEWRIIMAKAVMLALRAVDKEACRIQIVDLARTADRLRGVSGDEIGDQSFAVRRLLPIIDGKILLPDFITSDK